MKSCIWSLRNLYYPSQCLQSQLGCLDGRGGPKNPGARFSEKNPGFFKFNGPVTTLRVLQPSQINQMVSPEALPARAVFARSIKMLGWQPGAPKFREHDLPKKPPNFLKFVGPATPLWVVYPSENMHLGSTERLLARAVFARSIKVLG